MSKLEALKSISTHLSKKEAVPDDLWGKAGVPKDTKLKAINTAIADHKKNVSQQNREAEKQAIQKELEEEAEQTGKNLEEVMEAHKQAQRSANQQKDDRSKGGRDRKALESDTHAGKFDMQKDYV